MVIRAVVRIKNDWSYNNVDLIAYRPLQSLSICPNPNDDNQQLTTEALINHRIDPALRNSSKGDILNTKYSGFSRIT